MNIDKKKLGIVISSFAIGAMAGYGYLYLQNFYRARESQRNFMRSIYGKEAADKIMKVST